MSATVPPVTWRAFLKGHSFDLELLVEQFDRGRARVMRSGDEFWLASPSFDELPDVSAVQTAASRLLGEVNGAAKLIDGSFRAVELQDRFSDGTGVHVVLAGGTAEARSRMNIGTVVIRDAQGTVVPSLSPTPTKALAYLDTADRYPAAREVLQMLSVDHPDWFALFKVKEVVEADAGGLDAFATKNEISAFSASANNPDVSGEAARHARHKGSAPRHSMTIGEGRTLIRRVVQGWLAAK